MTWRLEPAEHRWRERALCSDQNPDQFFPGRGKPAAKKRPCSECPVKRECLEFALSSPYRPFGIWGDLMPKEVQRLWESRHLPNAS